MLNWANRRSRKVDENSAVHLASFKTEYVVRREGERESGGLLGILFAGKF